MISRRDVISSLCLSAVSIAGCIYRSSADKKPPGCPEHPTTAKAFCTDEEITLSKYKGLGENSFILRLDANALIEIDPSAYAYYSERAGEWSLEASTDPEKSEGMQLSGGQQFEWIVTFDRERPSAGREEVITLAPHHPDVWNALAMPIWKGDDMETHTFVFSREQL